MYLKTERLILKPMCREYLNSTHEYAGDPENARLMLFLPNENIEETLKSIIRAENEFKKDFPMFYEMAVFYNNIHIGSVDMYINDERNSAEIGWIINKKYQGNGFAPEAAESLIMYAVNTLDIKHFTAHCDTENISSRKVMEKLGMSLKGESGGRKNKLSPQIRREYTFELDF